MASRPPDLLVPALQPRPYQLPALQAFERGTTRGVLVWHRRAGKDTTALAITVSRMLERVGTYYHVFPTYNQGRKALWDATDADGHPFLDAFPEAIVAQRREQEMSLRLVNGSLWQIVGAEDPDRLRGTSPVGVVLSEYAVQNPAAWDILRPILAENGGWALFAYTPNGKNHGWTLWQAAQQDPTWFTQCLTVETTRRADGSPVITPEAIAAEQRDGMTEELIQQEFYCSFEAGAYGSYYGLLLSRAQSEGRVRFVPWEPTLPVLVGWDLGRADVTALWFVQPVGREVRWLDHYENSGHVLDHYVKVLKERPYHYSEFALPHDIKVKEFLTPESRLERLQSAFPQTRMTVLPNESIQEGIDQLRTALPRSVFDATKCEKGLNALSSYRKKWDAERKTFLNEPVHDWASHSADAARMVALVLSGPRSADTRRQVQADPGDDPYAYRPPTGPRQLYAEPR